MQAPRFIDEPVKAQGGWLTFSRSHSQLGAEAETDPGSPKSRYSPKHKSDRWWEVRGEAGREAPRSL